MSLTRTIRRARERVARAIEIIKKRDIVYSEGSPGSFPYDLSEIEAVVHELCHWTALGHALPRRHELPRQPSEVAINAIVAHTLHNEDPLLANLNEFLTIAAELRVLRSLRVGWSRRHEQRLLAYATRGLEADGLPELPVFELREWIRKEFAMASRSAAARRIARLVLGAIRKVA